MPPEPPSLADDHDHAALDAALERQELEQIAQDLLGLLVFTGRHRVIEATAPIPWKVGIALVSDADQELRLLALTLALHAVLQTPDALLAAVRDLHARLAALAPRLELPPRPLSLPTRAGEEVGDD